MASESVIRGNYVHGHDTNSCGYCHRSDNKFAKSAGFSSSQMRADHYEKLMDRGWRRCGTYYYKVDIPSSCCWLNTIRLDVNEFEPSKEHKKVLNRFERYLRTGKMKGREKEKESEESKFEDENINAEEEKAMREENNLKSILRKATLQAVEQIITLPEMKNLHTTLRDGEKLQELISIDRPRKQIHGDFVTNVCLRLAQESNFAHRFDFLTTHPELLSSKTKIVDSHPDLKLSLLNASTVAPLMLSQITSCLPTPWQCSLSNQVFLNFKDSSITPTPKSESHSRTRSKKPQQKQQTESKSSLADLFEDDPATGSSQKPATRMFENLPIKFTMTLASNDFSEESLEIFQKYEAFVHKKAGKTKKDYERFLCENGLFSDKRGGDGPQGLFKGYGGYHMEYRLDGKLFAVGVLDLTQRVASSVYCFYDPAYHALSPGVLSALKEIEFVKERCEKVDPEFKWYYMGYYIQTCQKSVYKGKYKPSMLLCPGTYNWVYLKEVYDRIEKKETTRLDDHNPIINEMDLSGIDLETFVKTKAQIRLQGMVLRIEHLTEQGQQLLTKIFKGFAPSVGKDLMQELIFDFGG